MNQDTVVNLATQAMTLGLRGRRADPARRPRDRPRGQPLPGRHADPGAVALLHPEDHRPGAGDRHPRPVDARPAHQLRDQPLSCRSRRWSADDAARSSRTRLAGSAPQHVFGFFLVLARISPLFLVAPAFSSSDADPARAQRAGGGARVRPDAAGACTARRSHRCPAGHRAGARELPRRLRARLRDRLRVRGGSGRRRLRRCLRRLLLRLRRSIPSTGTRAAR